MHAADAPKSTDVPDWALAGLSIREIGGVRQKASAYINKVAANMGELATNMGANQLFPLFPVNAGIKPDGAALIYFVAPAKPELPVERAMVLPVSDAAAVKTALAGSIGMPTEENGIATYSIPQLPPDPDKPLLVKFVRANMLVAPSADVLKKLEEFLGARDAAALAGDADAVLALKVANIKRTYEPDFLIPILDAQTNSASATPEQTEALKLRIHAVMDRVWQTDTLEARVAFDTKKESASLEVSFNGQPGSALAKGLSGDAPTVTGHLNALLPYDPALLLTWDVNPIDAGNALRGAIEMSALKDSTDAAQQAKLKVLQALTTLAESVKGDAIVAFGAREGEPVTPVLASESPDPKKTMSGLLNAMNAAVGAKNGADAFALEFERDKDIADVKVVKIIGSSIGRNDPVVRFICDAKVAELKSVIVVSSGNTAVNTVGSMIRNATAPAAVAPEIKSIFDAIPKGSAALLVLRPMLALREIAAISNPKGPAENLTANLPTAPLALSVRVAGGRAALRLELPAAAAEAIFQFGLRLRRAGMRLDELFTPAGDVPAPPAP